MRRAKGLLWVSLVLVVGCGGPAKLNYPVELAYKGSEQVPSLPLGAPARRLLIAPFVDGRGDRARLGDYRTTFGPQVELRVPSEDLAAHLRRMVVDIFRRAGYQVVPGAWDGEAQSLLKLEADYAFWARVDAFEATGRGTLYDTRREMTVRMALKMGNKARGLVLTRRVEVSPTDRDVHFFGWGFDHYRAMAKFVNDTLSLALERGAVELAGRVAQP